MIRILTCAALILLSGCVTLDEYIQINGDGSAKIVLKYSMPVSGMKILKDSEKALQELNKQEDGSDKPRIFDVVKMKAHFKRFKDVHVISLRVHEEDDKMNAYINLQIDDLRKALREGLLPYTSLEKDDKNYVFSALYPFNLSRMKKKPSAALKDLEISFKVKTPGVINETNAHSKLANLAEWSYGPGKKSFAESDGKFTVKFDASKLSFLDEKKD
ncbi:MAG: hypothetical protein NE330_13580 [Lentisphaeraceae bacterium]|nr:hypothetical protein [Lentisphaeraceae bacterium]